MENENFTKWIINNAFIKTLTKDMNYFDALYVDPLVDNICEQNIELKKCSFDNAKFDVEIAKNEIDKYKHSISYRVLEAYGWTNNDVEKSILKYMPEEFMKEVDTLLRKKYGESEL